MSELEIPTSFLALHAAGRFDYWQAPYRSLTQHQRAKIVEERRAHVLWWKSIEWDDHSSAAAIRSFTDDSEMRPGLIPFAGNGYGDRYCWYPRWQVDGSLPVILFKHDEHLSELFAPDFETCLVRCMLQSYARWEPKDDGDERTKHALWTAHLAILRPVIGAAQHELLVSVGERLTASSCDAADDGIAASLPPRSLVGALQPTRYAEDDISDPAALLRLYEQSVAFYRELVEDEGLERFRAELAAASSNRDRFIPTTP